MLRVRASDYLIPSSMCVGLFDSSPRGLTVTLLQRGGGIKRRWGRETDARPIHGTHRLRETLNERPKVRLKIIGQPSGRFFDDHWYVYRGQEVSNILRSGTPNRLDFPEIADRPEYRVFWFNLAGVIISDTVDCSRNCSASELGRFAVSGPAITWLCSEWCDFWDSKVATLFSSGFIWARTAEVVRSEIVKRG